MNENGSEAAQNVNRNPISANFIAIIGIFATLIAGFGGFLLSKQTRALSYDSSSSRVFGKPNASFKLLFNGKEAEKVFISDITIINSGNVPIKKQEIIDGVSLSIDEGYKILSYSIYKSTPESATIQYKSNVSQTQEQIIFKPSLLNPGDGLTLRVISSSCDAKPQINARIEGISELIS